MATIEHIIAFCERIPTSFGKILSRITADWAGKVKEALFLLLEVTQARRNQANIFGVS